ncbi:MAG: hypothetical protein R3C13_03600 [Hyphomonas sp.]|uniref:hypothetical protein n=1 Tax=Hyphomonas sp. TaxID=87 RepID=UPI003529AEC3
MVPKSPSPAIWACAGLLAASCIQAPAEVARPSPDVTRFSGAVVFDGDTFTSRAICTKGAQIITHLPCYQDSSSDPEWRLPRR